MSLSFLITLGLTVVILAVAAGLTARTHAARPAVAGIGLVAVVVGYWLTGMTDLTINGIASLIGWFQRTVFTNQVAWGVGLLVGGLILAVIGALLPKGTARPREPKPSSAAAGAGAGTAAVARPSTDKAAAPVAAPRARGKQAAKGLDPEDAEIEELLRKRGIM